MRIEFPGPTITTASRLDAMAPAKISLKVSQRSVDNPSAGKNLFRRSDTLDHELREYTR